MVGSSNNNNKRSKNNNQAALHVGEMNKLNCRNYLPQYAENGPKTKDKRNRQRTTNKQEASEKQSEKSK